MKDHIIGRRSKFTLTQERKLPNISKLLVWLETKSDLSVQISSATVEMVPIPIAWPLTPIDLLPQAHMSKTATR